MKYIKIYIDNGEKNIYNGVNVDNGDNVEVLFPPRHGFREK